MATNWKRSKKPEAAGAKPPPMPKIYPVLQIGFSQQLVRGTDAPRLEVTASAGSFDRSYDWTVFIGDEIYDLSDGSTTNIPEMRDHSHDAKLTLEVFPSKDEKLKPGQVGDDEYDDVRMLTIVGKLIDKKKDVDKEPKLEYLSQPLKDRVA